MSTFFKRVIFVCLATVSLVIYTSLVWYFSRTPASQNTLYVKFHYPIESKDFNGPIRNGQIRLRQFILDEFDPNSYGIPVDVTYLITNKNFANLLVMPNAEDCSMDISIDNFVPQTIDCSGLTDTLDITLSKR